MAGFVTSHLVDGVVDRIEIVLLCELCKLELACGCAVLGLYTHFKILLGGVGDDLAEKLRKLCCVLRFLKRCLLPVESDLGITLTGCDSAHCEVHTDLGAFAFKIRTESADDLLSYFFGNVCAELLADADNVLCCPALLSLHLGELAAGDLALGAEFGRSISLVNITAYGANPFFHNIFPPMVVFF